MPRSGEKVRRRLQQAALELYRKQGFDATTTAQIAARAKVTERTFFRHFADKREVLFDGEAALRDSLVAAVKEMGGGHPALSPIQILLRAFRTILPLVERNRPFTEPRAEVIAANQALRERALAKNEHLNEALASALREIGIADRWASLAPPVFLAAFRQAARSSRDHPTRSLEAQLDQALEDLAGLSSSRASARRPEKTASPKPRRPGRARSSPGR